MKKIIFFTLCLYFFISGCGPKSKVRNIVSDGDNYYYGIGVKQDYKKAYELYSAPGDVDDIMLFIMQVNGEGVKRDLDEAEKTIDRFCNPGGSDYDQFKFIVRDRRRLGAAAAEKLTYCGFGFSQTYAITRCAGIKAGLKTMEYMAERKKLLAKAGWFRAAKINRLFDAADVFFEKDRHRKYLENEKGTLRGVFSYSQTTALINGFLEMAEGYIAGNSLTAKSAVEINTAKQRYLSMKESLVKITREDAAMYGDSGDKDNIEKNWIPALLASETAFKKYMDAWVDLMLEIKPVGLNPEEIKAAIKTDLYKRRRAQLNWKIWGTSD